MFGTEGLIGRSSRLFGTNRRSRSELVRNGCLEFGTVPNGEVDGPMGTDDGEATWVTVREAAARHGVTERCVLKWVQSGKVEARRQGRRWFVLCPVENGNLEIGAGSGKPLCPAGHDVHVIHTQLPHQMLEESSLLACSLHQCEMHLGA